ncbi:formylmethanofuran dehydrogenase subunit C [Anatilimnocola floriformis]|uniref:formylmethanofuran dehydrogenase subunit C n=1 Tax=Anatilimnocola floriformis TaxID=2948575 RepID=UPI0020C373C3|nr:formylmethanofuran dehydrogenase subunit C [Anatilimnocola floriformis]
MTITFYLKREPTVPLEAEVLSPDVMADLSNAEIRALTVFHGKRQVRLDEFFDVEGERSADLELHGGLHKVRWIGHRMSRGSVVIRGSAGTHLGAYMRGGRIEVHGDAGDWIGAEMRDGLIHVHGNAGGQIGAAYRGSLRGMTNGTIIVDGAAGVEVGMRMRRGTIVVGGPAQDFAGLQMKGGTIILLSGAEIRTGAWMKRGTIISLKPLHLMPTFTQAADTNPTFVSLIAKYLQPLGVKLPHGDNSVYRHYSGDLAVSDKGEILVWQAAS